MSEGARRDDDFGDGSVTQLYDTTGRSPPEHADAVSGEASAEELIEIIKRARQTRTTDGIWLQEMDLPGFGTEYDDCGDDFPRFCSHCGAVGIFQSTCYRSTCPRCAASWARRQSTSKVAQLEQLRRYRQDFKEKHQRFHHLVISPPAHFQPDSDPSWERALEIVKEILAAADLEGFIFYHPFRGMDGDDRGEWKRRLFSERDFADIEDELRFAPHFHAVVVGHEVPGGQVTRSLEAATDWVLHRITKEGTNVSIYDHYDLARAVTYCLSHTGIYETEHQKRAACRSTGRNLTQRLSFDPDENEEDQLLLDQSDAVVRSVAPTTLGLPYQSLACTVEYHPEDDVGDQETTVDVAKAEASRYTGYNSAGDDRDLDATAATSSTSSSSSGVDDIRGMDGATDDLDRSELRSLEDVDVEPETCEGRMLSIAKAPRFLEDDEWLAEAHHADDLRETYEEWSDKLEWLGG